MAVVVARPAEAGHQKARGHLMSSANERQRVSLASGAGRGAPASEPVGESEGQSPSDKNSPFRHTCGFPFVR